MNPRMFAAAALVLICVVGVAIPVGLANAQQATAHDPTDDGKRVFKTANCMGCHKWHGNGGGGYGGDALSLRKTQPTREPIIETVTWGGPGTRLPVFRAGS